MKDTTSNNTCKRIFSRALLNGDSEVAQELRERHLREGEDQRAVLTPGALSQPGRATGDAIIHQQCP